MYYIASPYTAKNDPHLQDDRFKAVEKFVAHLMANTSIIPFSPIVYCHALANQYSLPTDYKYYKNFNGHMMDISSGMIIFALDGWRQSLGVLHEIEFYQNNLRRSIQIADPLNYELSTFE